MEPESPPEAAKPKKSRAGTFYGLILAYVCACGMQFGCLVWIAVFHLRPAMGVVEILGSAFGEYLPWISGWLAMSGTMADIRGVGEAFNILFVLGLAVGLPAFLYVRYARLVFWIWLTVGLGAWFFFPMLLGLRIR